MTNGCCASFLVMNPGFSLFFAISWTCINMRKWRTIIKNTFIMSSPLSRRTWSVEREALVFFVAIASVSLKIDAESDGVTNSSII